MHNFSFAVNTCIFINTEYWPEYSFNRFLGVLCKPGHPIINFKSFLQFFSVWKCYLFFFHKTPLQVRKVSFKGIFVSASKQIMRGNLIFTRIVHLESNISHFCSFSLFDRALWYFLWVRRSNFKITFTTAQKFLSVSQPNLLNCYLTNFGACSANQWTQNHM